MTLALTIVWAILISFMGVVGAYVAKRQGRSDALIALYVTLVVFSSIAASKTVAFDLGFAEFYAPATVLIFSITFLLTDIVNEKFGKRETQRMILIALAAQVLVGALSYVVVSAQGAPFFTEQSAFETLLGSVPRIVAASMIAFYISENVDAIVYHWFRKLTKGKHLWARNVFSSAPSMLLDSVLFVTIAFYGLFPIMPVIIGLTVTKWLVGVVDIPIMYLSRWVLGTSVAPIK